jgi:hypothetical protein
MLGIKLEEAQTFLVVAFFGSTPLSPTLRKQLFEFKNEDAIKKSENLRDTCALHQHLSMARSNHKTVPLTIFILWSLLVVLDSLNLI